jgi:hypothetical protein
MPVLTEEELQDIVNKETEAKAKIEEKNQFIVDLQNEREKVENQRRGFLISTIILGVLFVFLLLTVLFQPSIFNLNQGEELQADETIIQKSQIEDYENRISDLEQQLNNSINPLTLDEFYAVQLGAFKKFNTKLSSDSFSIVHNASYKDFNLFTLGVFETQEEAEQLRKVVSQLKFDDAFVGYYKGGERIKANY